MSLAPKRNHSELPEFLRNLMASNNERLIAEILRFTSGGIVEEAGALVATADGEGVGPVVADVMLKASTSGTGFKFSQKSLKELNGVNADLVRCVGLALTVYSRVDFTVYDGIRTRDEQARYVKAGTSKTMKSKHLEGLAVDLVPIIGGIPKWDWTGCYEIAFAMDQAATHMGIADRITWGGCWDKTLAEYGGDASAYIAAVEAYKTRHHGPDFIDGPHFEIRP